jgi:hypothetical protein
MQMQTENFLVAHPVAAGQKGWGGHSTFLWKVKCRRASVLIKIFVLHVKSYINETVTWSYILYFKICHWKVLLQKGWVRVKVPIVVTPTLIHQQLHAALLDVFNHNETQPCCNSMHNPFSCLTELRKLIKMLSHYCRCPSKSQSASRLIRLALISVSDKSMILKSRYFKAG